MRERLPVADLDSHAAGITRRKLPEQFLVIVFPSATNALSAVFDERRQRLQHDVRHLLVNESAHKDQKRPIRRDFESQFGLYGNLIGGFWRRRCAV